MCSINIVVIGSLTMLLQMQSTLTSILLEKGLNLETQMIVVPQIQIHAKLIMLAIRMRMEVTQMLAPFLDCVHELNPKKVVMMLAI